MHAAVRLGLDVVWFPDLAFGVVSFVVVNNVAIVSDVASNGDVQGSWAEALFVIVYSEKENAAPRLGREERVFWRLYCCFLRSP